MDTIENVDDLKEAARRIADLGPRYVVVKGGMELPGDDAVDIVYDGSEFTELRAPKIGDQRVAGAGCTFAAAITAELARGTDVLDAVRVAKEFTRAGITASIATRAPQPSIGLAGSLS